jgi:hypothetical protein
VEEIVLVRGERLLGRVGRRQGQMFAEFVESAAQGHGSSVAHARTRAARGPVLAPRRTAKRCKMTGNVEQSKPQVRMRFRVFQ